MKRLFSHRKLLLVKAIGALVLGASATSAFALSPVALTGWTVQNGKLMDPNGNPFIFRGVTIDHGRAPDKTIQALKDIAALGANSAQIEFPLNWTVPFTYPRTAVTELIGIIKTCAENKLVCVLEPNDVAGFGVVDGVASPSNTASLWDSSDMRMALSAPGVTNHIIIGFGNQHFGHGTEQFYRDTAQSYTHGILSSLPPNFMIMLDGSDWSQDTTKAMHYVAQGISQDSTLKNRVIFSVDFFDDYQDPEKVRDYIASFAEIGVPLVVGGFGPAPYYHPFNTTIPVQLNAPQLPAASVMQYAQQYGAGYFGWSWSGNENSALDLVANWNANALTNWGNLLFNDVNGIKATAKPASIFNGTTSSASSSSVASNNFPVAVIDNVAMEYVRCGVVYGKASALRSTDSDGDTLSYKWTVSGPENYTSTNSEIRFSMFWPLVEYRVNLEVSDGKGGVSVATTVMKHSYSNVCPQPSSSASSHSKSTSNSSSSIRSSSSVQTSSSSLSSLNSSRSSSRSSSSTAAVGKCSYIINSQWNNGFTAAIRIKNTTSTVISGWNVNWQYADGSKVTNLWNATLSGTNPYNAKNLSWNSTIQPGQTVEFGFQGTKSAAVASIPAITGAVCE